MAIDSPTINSGTTKVTGNPAGYNSGLADGLPYNSPADAIAAGDYMTYYLAAMSRQGNKAPSTYAPASTINEQAQTIPEITAAEGAVIPEVYGIARVAARVATAVVYNKELYLLCVWCGGPVDSVVKVMNGETVVDVAKVHSYTGDNTQNPDAWLTAAIPGYADNLRGICYSVVKFTATEAVNTRLIAEIKGRNDVYDPRIPGNAWTDNPSLCLAHVIDTYTPVTPYWASVTTCANENDALVTGAKRRTIGLSLENAATVDSVIDTMREYAGCFVHWSDTATLVPNRPRAVDHTFAATNILGIDIRKRGMNSLPNRVTVQYTDTSATDWKQAQATVSNVVAGAELREQVITLNGYKSHPMAVRQATERLNYYRLCDLQVTLEVFDNGLIVTRGDVISVTHPLGLTNKWLRVLDAVAISPGRWSLETEEYSAGVFSDDVTSKDAYSDTDLPAPAAPAPATSLVLTEVGYRLQIGKYATRLRIAWTASPDAFLLHYRVTVTQASAIVFQADVGGGAVSIETSPLQELQTYDVTVVAVNTFGDSTALIGSKYMLGKTTVPSGAGMVLNGFEVGGEVRLAWTPDTSDYDIERYELRYSSTAGSWESASLIDITDALTHSTKNIPPGTWRFYVKSLDSVRTPAYPNGQYSTASSYKDIVVTSDDRAFQVGAHVCTEGSTTYLHKTVEERGGPDVYYSNGADTWDAMFPNAMSTYTGALLSYQSAQGTSEFLSDEWDTTSGASNKTGDWLASSLNVTDLSGTATEQLGLKAHDAGAYTYGELSQKDSARWARVRVQSTGLFKLTMSPTIALSTVVREERGSDTSSSTTYKRINLTNEYSAARSIQVTPLFAGSAAAVVPAVDNVVIGIGVQNSFDVYIFDAANPATKLERNFSYLFSGV